MTDSKDTAKKAEPKPTTSVKLGEMLVYRVPKDDAEEHNGLRNTAADKHQGHKIKSGDEVPLIVTALGNEGKFNGQAFLDGNDTLWVKGTTLGEDDGQCFRQKA